MLIELILSISLYVFAFIFCKQRLHEQSLDTFLDELEKIRDALCQNNNYSSNDTYLCELMLYGRRCGVSLTKALNILIKECSYSKRYLEQQRKWPTAYLLHTGLLFFFFLLIRHYIKYQLSVIQKTETDQDSFIVLIAFLPISLVSYFIVKKSHFSWLWHHELTDKGKEWVEALFSLKRQEGELAKKIIDLKKRERRLGQSFSSERETLIDLYALKQKDEFEQKQNHLQDMYPFLELISFSLAAFFLLCLPLHAYLLSFR